jgi:hypothetical protein
LKRSLFVEIQNLADWLSRYPALTFVMSWAVLGFELSIISVLAVPNFIEFYFIVAVIFHFLVYLTFGLNRFFWSWMCAWPAMIFVSQCLLSIQINT